MRLLPFAFVRLVCPLHSTSILPDAQTGVRPTVTSKSKGVYKDSTGIVKLVGEPHACHDGLTHLGSRSERTR